MKKNRENIAVWCTNVMNLYSISESKLTSKTQSKRCLIKYVTAFSAIQLEQGTANHSNFWYTYYPYNNPLILLATLPILCDFNL